MGKMREWWANVYPHVEGPVKIGGKFSSQIKCESYQADFAAFRIHVRLKPEGAPKRYASEAERYCWNTWPADMRRGYSLADMLGPAYASPRRDLKTEGLPS